MTVGCCLRVNQVPVICRRAPLVLDGDLCKHPASHEHKRRIRGGLKGTRDDAKDSEGDEIVGATLSHQKDAPQKNLSGQEAHRQRAVAPRFSCCFGSR